MARKIRIKRSSTSTSTTTEESKEWLLRGKQVQIGTEVLVQHYSSNRWVKATIKEVKESPKNGKLVFFFYLANPGWVALHEDRIKFPPKVRINKKQKGDVHGTEN